LAPKLDGDALPPSVGAFHYTRYAPWLPPLEGGMEPGRHPVVIVGGGPVGMSLALGLANHGVRSVVLEADDTVCVGSRAACVSRRSLEIIERLGALPAFLEKGFAWTSTTSSSTCWKRSSAAMPPSRASSTSAGAQSSSVSKTKERSA
jgi:3-(3-hydroxy-phenyl)propionate hydroxylase